MLDLASTRAAVRPSRNFPLATASVDDLAALRLRREDLWLPSPFLDRAALLGNVAGFASWVTSRGLSHAPHGKTSMAPQLWDLQLEAGACGIVAASVAQARAMSEVGVARIFIAHQVPGRDELRWVATTGCTVTVLADSVELVNLMDQQLLAVGAQRRVPVLVEVGFTGGRTGARSGCDEAVVDAVLAARNLELAGVQCFEGSVAGRRSPENEAVVVAVLRRALELFARCRNAAPSAPLIFSAGGSMYFDLVADRVHPLLGDADVEVILRSGCYLTHDDGMYWRDSPLSAAIGGFLRPALRVLAHVVSAPEPNLYILAAGKRDLGHDVDLPFVMAVDGKPVDREAEEATVFRMDDHHAYVRHQGVSPNVGAIVELGISHPCTVFDKWPLIPVLEEGFIVDVVATEF